MKQGESLGFLIQLPVYGSHPDLDETSSSNAAFTVAHEVQHVKIDHAQIRTNGKLSLSPSEHHKFMKSNTGLINERINVLKQVRPDFNNLSQEEFKKKVNAFEN